jgi:hypothetical protein
LPFQRLRRRRDRLLVLSAVFAGFAWWFRWSVERFVGRRGASWDGLGEFSDWIRTGQ